MAAVDGKPIVNCQVNNFKNQTSKIKLPFPRWFRGGGGPGADAEKKELLARHNAAFRRFDQDRPLTEYDFTVFDTELTGLHRRRDEIVAIGAVRIRGLRIVAGEILHSHIRPGDLKPTDSTLIHRITPEQLVAAPGPAEVLENFIRFIGPSLLVGHYVGLDMHFVNRAARRIFGGRLKNPCLDTMLLAEAYTQACWEHYYDRFNPRISYNLTDLSRHHGLPLFEAHEALQDAFQTAYLFLFLVKKLQHLGCRTLRDLFKAGQRWRLV